MSIDVVIVSNASNEYLKNVTQQCIDSVLESESEIGINVFVVEKEDYYYDGAVTVMQYGEFGYNKYLNQGASLGDGEYICFANNDLVFEKGWATKLINAMKENNVNSACPYSPISNIANNTSIKENSGVYEGYEIRKNFVGWCFVWTRKLWNRIKLDERLLFWACDNACAEQLKLANEKHILVTDSIVHHLDNGSFTLNSLQPYDREKFLHPEVKKFNRLYNANYFGLGKDIDGLVTVIIPVYGNMEYWKPFLKRASESALNQTVKAKHVLISVGKDLQDARNISGLKVDSEYILFLDADDTLDEHYIEEMLKVQDADIIVPAVHKYEGEKLISTDQFWYTPKPLIDGNYAVIGSLIKSELFKRLGGFENLELYEDWSFYLRAEELGAVFKQCPAAIYQIHVRENSRNEPSAETKAKMFLQIRNEALKRRNLL